ncbi:class E sortase [Streptomyces abikoensis]|uniref:Class E sortase n=1 Tax=Streptomyces abikoensis TaxID=97398 RepID=A0ABW7T7Q8_9ACTN
MTAAYDSGAYAPGAVAQPLPPEDEATMTLRRVEPEGPARSERPERPVVTGGRAERRRAAQRAARARRDSPGVIASRVVGELFITLGVVMLLFVAYQLWWTNVIAHRQAGGTADSLRHSWDKGGAQGAARDAGEFSPGQGFAIIYIPKLDVKAPIAEGVGKHQVLDRGMVGHYATGSLKTAMPWDRQGNFALAGHRNTHGEPFRYVNRLQPGDKVVVETQSTFYTYEMTSRLDQTSPANTKVIDPVPAGSGFTGPGRYITLTTCTPEFTSTYRMVVWGKMVDERPRSKGKPDALVE